MGGFGLKSLRRATSRAPPYPLNQVLVLSRLPWDRSLVHRLSRIARWSAENPLGLPQTLLRRCVWRRSEELLAELEKEPDSLYQERALAYVQIGILQKHFGWPRPPGKIRRWLKQGLENPVRESADRAPMQRYPCLFPKLVFLLLRSLQEYESPTPSWYFRGDPGPWSQTPTAGRCRREVPSRFVNAPHPGL